MSYLKKIFIITAVCLLIFNLINRNKLLQSFEKNKTIENQIKKTTIVRKVKNKKLSNTTTYNTIKKSVKHTSSKTENTIEEEERDNPWGAYDQDYDRTMNPNLGRPTPEILPSIVQENIIQQRKRTDKISYAIPGTASAPWIERGPNNVGGRTKALAWDPNDPAGKKVWAGGQTGGLWYNNDITDSLSSWNKVNDFWGNLSISDIVFDPQNTKIIYVTTGAHDKAPGVGIYKSIDAGITWNILSSTSNFNYIVDLKIRVENGISILYCANHYTYNISNFFRNSLGLFTSIDGGMTWSNKSIPVPYRTNAVMGISTIDINKASNRIWLSTNQNYEDSDGSGGRVYYNDNNLNNGLIWNKSDSVKVDSAWDNNSTVVSAPSNPNIAYSIISSKYKVVALRKTTNAGASWISIPLPVDADEDIEPTDFTRGQAFIHQTLAVDPNNHNIVIIGGINLFKSIDGGNTWKQISKWSENSKMDLLTKISTVHADHLNIVYKPGSSNEVIFGTDGGIFYTSNIKGADSLKVINSRNNNYNITQFYSAAIHPNKDSAISLAGAQDNGTQLFDKLNINTTRDIGGGDGGYCFIDQFVPDVLISSTTNNKFYKQDLKNAYWFNKIKLLNNKNNGAFINYAAYDNNLHILYTNRNDEYVYRVSNVTGVTPKVDSIKINGLTNDITVSSMMVSPYNELSSTLYLGTKDASDKPKLLKVLNAQSTPQTIDISSSLFPIRGNISSIAFGRDENELAVTFYNYGIASVWYTRDGGTNWQNKDNSTLPNIPIRWAIFNPNKYGEELVLATELGIYSTTNLSANSPIWTQTNNGFANVRTDMLQLRNSDFTLIASTHGRGLFSSKAFSEAAAPIISSITSYNIGDGDTLFVKGKNLTNTNQVKIGGYTISKYTVINDSSVRLIIDGAYSGRLSIKTPGGIATLENLKYNTPTILSFTPTSGGLYTTMTIKGDNLSNIKKVIIGNRDAINFSIKSDTVITATIPDSAQDGTVRVVNESHYFEKTGFKACATPKVNTSGPISFCEGGSVSLSISAATSVNWLNLDSQKYFSTDTVVKINKTGTYLGYVLANNCLSFTKFMNVVVNPLPTKPTVTSSIICEGQNATITAPSGTFTYTWIVPSGVVTPSTKTNSFTTTKAGTYSVSITNSNGCTSSEGSGTVIVNTVPIKPTVTSSTICEGQNATITATSGTFTYTWTVPSGVVTPSTSTSSFTTTKAGTYSVTLTNNNGCISEVGSGIVTVNPVPAKPTVTSIFICEGQSGTISSPAGTFTYTWTVPSGVVTPSTSTNSFTTTKAGIYRLTLTNSNGCISEVGSGTATIQSIPNTPIITRDNAGFLISGAAGTTWYKDGIAIADTSQIYKPVLPGNYSAKTTINGCASSISSPYYYLVTDLINLSEDEYIKLSPNPFVGFLNLEFKLKNYQKLNVQVINVSNGNIVYSVNDVFSGTKLQLSNISAGIYVLRVKTNDSKNSYQFKMIKQ
jgi:photosystem II stability/assembly factor-like uncharacterized protein